MAEWYSQEKDGVLFLKESLLLRVYAKCICKCLRLSFLNYDFSSLLENQMKL